MFVQKFKKNYLLSSLKKVDSSTVCAINMYLGSIPAWEIDTYVGLSFGDLGVLAQAQFVNVPQGNVTNFFLSS